MVKDDENKEFTEGTIGILNDSITFMFFKRYVARGNYANGGRHNRLGTIKV